ncbi:transporter [Haloferacaceae archaeon DSL9]
MVRLSTIGFLVAIVLLIAPIPPIGVILGSITLVASIVARVLGH